MTRMMQWRAAMAVIGGLAGGSLWALYRVAMTSGLPPRLTLALAAFTGAFFIGLMAMAGPLRPLRASARAAGVAVVATLLLMLLSLRFASVDALTESTFGLGAFFAVMLLPLPFCIAGGARDYATLFVQSWGIVVRYLVALLFTLLVWGMVLLSDALLGIVGIDWIGGLIERSGPGMVLTGVAFGLAIAVADELAGEGTPHLILRLLRLLIPVVLIVLVIFIGALPMQGLSGLFGGLSAGGTLLAICIAVTTLVTVAVDRTDAEAVQQPLVVACTKALAVLLPLPAALALWAVALRVGDYGWTPSRLASALAGGVALTYGLAYLFAVLRGHRWAGMIRRSNVVLALAVLGIAALWQTPLLNAEAISARSQAARITAGTVPEVATLRAFGDWGHPGAALLARLEEGAEGDLALRLAEARGQSRPVSAADLIALVPVRPDDARAQGERILRAADASTRARWAAQCRNRLGDGQTGCALVVGPFLTGRSGVQGIFLGAGIGGVSAEGLVLADDELSLRAVVGTADNRALEDALAGRLTFEPVPENQLRLGDMSLRLDRY